MNYWPEPARRKNEDAVFIPVVPRGEGNEKDKGSNPRRFTRLIAGVLCNSQGFPPFLDSAVKRTTYLYFELEKRIICSRAGPDEEGASFAELGITVHTRQMTGPFFRFITGRVTQDWRS